MSIKIKDVEFGAGIPKICVPVTGRTQEEIREQLDQMKGQPFDLVEWRVDFFREVFDQDALDRILCEIRTSLGKKPLLFTFRTKWEGGQTEITQEAYENLNRFAAESGKIDLIDVELFRSPKTGEELEKMLKKWGVKVVGSNHDFEKTPSEEELIRRLQVLKKYGADIPKIAVMPRDAKDVLSLLQATWKFHTAYPEVPVITMAMGKIGAISRMTGEIFGSSVTFGSVAASSAPGQIPAKNLRDILEILHEN